MIDFRYHLVSLVAVFLALAVGVVLGAGPLREAVGAALTDQVQGLREREGELSRAVAERDEQLAGRDAVIAAAAPRLVAGSLEGTSVVVVLLPGADAALADGLAGQLAGAGAAVTGRVALQPSWLDPGQQTFRSTLAGQLVPYLDPRPAADATASAQLAAALAQAVLRPAAEEEDAADPSPALESLRSAELVALEGDPAQRAAAAVVVAPARPSGPAADWAPLLGALEARGAGTVLAGPAGAAAEGGDLAPLRADGATGVSTVDSAEAPAGQLAVVLALREQLDGGGGHYGAGAGATAPLPAGA